MLIHDNLLLVKSKIAGALARAGRDIGEAHLIAVSKTFPPAAVQEACDAGHKVFGENRVQELLTKVPQLPLDVKWHLIGHLQSNKVRKVLPWVEMIHSVDSLALARDIDRVAGELGLRPKILLEVNVSGESSKFGFSPEVLKSEFFVFGALAHVEVMGLMTVPPLGSSAEESRPHFVTLRKLRDQLSEQSGSELPVLSMGMSGDYEVAIEEGATLVRVGSAIFGGR